tara:strand:- start:898 stop:1752 length:855 start_codon:yes stop_codon:yes gene_type:complete
VEADGFYLGTHRPSWLARVEVPLFVSRRTLQPYKKLPKSTSRWALDSGGFTELRMHGKWSLSPEEYADEVRRYSAGVGNMDWAAIQDWMCEPLVRNGGGGKDEAVGTGLSVEEHQRRTVQSYLDLTAIAPEIPWAPVIQGWELEEYEDHVEMYSREGVDLKSLPVVGLGSVCRRQAEEDIAYLVSTLSSEGIKLHGFGIKRGGLFKIAHLLESADSLAWSYTARMNPHLFGDSSCRSRHKTCANCISWAMKWRESLVSHSFRPYVQMSLFSTEQMNRCLGNRQA